jgi:threonine dehydrogenase-like Zn-dependent dehydrogenase
MKAVVFAGEGRVAVEDVPTPRIEESADAIVKVDLTAICGSDLHLLDGKTPGMRTGGVIGHEFIGTVVEEGGATDRPVGSRVLGSFLIACGRCRACNAARFNHCNERRALGLGTLTGDLDGAQAEYVRVPGANLNLHDLEGPLGSLSDEKALFCGDVFATAMYCAHLAAAEAGDTVAVIGGGPIGLLTALSIQRVGGARAIVLDMDQQRVDFAAKLGLEGLLVGGDDAADAVRQANDGEPADVVVDAVGSVAVFKTAMRCIREGGRVVVIGVYGAERVELSLGRAWINGIEIRFSGMANVQAHWDEALAVVASGEIDPTGVVTHRLDLGDAVEGYELFRSREAMKVILQP